MDETQQMIQQRKKAETYSICEQWEETVAKKQDKICFHYIGDPENHFPPRTLSFNEVDAIANQVAHWALKQGFKKGDTVALFFENRPEFVCVWLGFAKLGVITAWINNTIKLTPLVHSISVSKAKMVIFGAELSHVVKDVARDLTRNGIEQVAMTGTTTFCRSIDGELYVQPTTTVSNAHRKGVKYSDTMCYIYTSGTTGLPKASIIQHQRYCDVGIRGIKLFSDTDVGYGGGMPLYHSAAGMIGIGYVVCAGLTYVIRKKFSANNWLSDVRKYKVTIGQYIGELARYILSTPKKTDDAVNTLRFMIGNGLRPEYWDKFQMRFGIDIIVEFYGSTEGTVGLQNYIFLNNLKNGNYDGYGAVGQMTDPNIVFLKYDVEKDELMRDSNGYCMRAKVNEPGEMVVKVVKGETEFIGYTNKEATKKKLLQNVFTPGDVYTRTGDLMKVDGKNWVYFVDRIGDTFRWKGENVSTAEVASELAKFPNVDEVNVYGVQIPNNEDGRAGCCAMIMPDTSPENLKRFHQHASSTLPSYAVPVFLRILPQMQITGTFKHQKVQMRNDGIDPLKVSDSIFYLEKGVYKLMDMAAYQKITSAQSRL
jgi:fatty-acyl-CoA synthase